MEFKIENNNLIISPKGVIDSTNAESVGNEIAKIRTGNKSGNLVLDFSEIKYVSSAGLRQILRIRKEEKVLNIINVSNDVYDVFDMTGFVEMMNISKAYRKLSVDGCELIGEGSNGIVYRINDDTIIKVYKNNDALEDIKREKELARKALVLGINTAIPYDVVQVGDKYGSVFELLSSKTIAKLLDEEPENIDKYAKIFTDLLLSVHHTVVSENTFPQVKDTVIDWVQFVEKYLSKESYAKLLKLVKDVPYDSHVIHGDYHPGNVHYANNEAILIDMDTLSTGNPVFEFASIFNALIGYSSLNHNLVKDFLGFNFEIAQKFLNKVMEIYFNTTDKNFIESQLSKAKIIGFTRILRRTIKREPDNQELIRYAQNEIEENLKKVDSLAY